MLLAGSTRFLFLGFCTGARAVTRAPARNPRWAARVTGGSHFSRCAICRAHKPLGWGWWSGSRRQRHRRQAHETEWQRGFLATHQPLPASPRGANGGPVSSGPLWSFPQAAQRHKGGQNASAALHQSRPVGARLHGRRGTQHSKRPVRGAAARARSRSHRPLQLGSCYSTAAHRVAARTLSNRACAGLGGFPGAHCFTQAIAIL